MEGEAGAESCEGDVVPAEPPQARSAASDHAEAGGEAVEGASESRSFSSSSAGAAHKKAPDPAEASDLVLGLAVLPDRGERTASGESLDAVNVDEEGTDSAEERSGGSEKGSDESRGEDEGEDHEEARDVLRHPLDTLDKPCVKLPPQLAPKFLPPNNEGSLQSSGVGLTVQWADIKDSVFTDQPCQRTAFKPPPVKRMDSLHSIAEIDMGEDEEVATTCNDNIKAATREAWYNKNRIAVDRTATANHLGKGPASVVYRATLDEQDAVIKIVSLREPNPAGLDDIIIAMRTTYKIKHPNLVSFFGGSFTPDADILFIFSEHMNSGSLEQLFVSKWSANKGKLFTKSWRPSAAIAASWICDVARGLCFLHEFLPTCVHGHLSMSNILLSKDLSIAKVSDYVFNSKYTTRTEHPGEDIYALGLVIFQLGIGKLIWKQDSYTAARTGLKEKDSIFVDENKIKPDVIRDKRLRSLFIQCSAPMSDTSEIGIRQILADFEQDHLQNIGKQLKV